ncbi:MAG: DUF1080 domain-containing protein, partial [Verrucomicrobiaceae bacterium]|nr:DUF1080 domain-containing protein [Verrucomicrobiaceae bacterium]
MSIVNSYLNCLTAYICLSFLVPGSLDVAMGQEVYIGASEISITPDRPVALEGAFALRISDGIQSPIVASVVIIESRNDRKVSERSVMVSADLVHLPMEMVHAVRKKIALRYPEWDVSKIFISTTHTHQAPVVMRDNFIIPKHAMSVAEYIDFFVGQVTRGIVTAHENLQKGSIAWGLGSAMVAYNRRTTYLNGSAQVYADMDRPDYKGPEGPEYQGLPMIFFFDQAGKPLAAAVNVWSPSQEYFGSRKISADFWHPVRVRLKKKLGKDFVTLAWCGASGDQGPHRRVHVEAEDRMRKLRGLNSWLEEFGRRIANSVIDTYNLVHNERHHQFRHAHVMRLLPLPGWKLTGKELQEIRGWRDSLSEELKAEPERAHSLARPISWRSQLLKRQEAMSKRENYAYDSEIHVLRIGEVAICTNQFELYTEYGLRMLARSDAHMTCVVQLTGPAHYLPTREAVQGGGYGAIPESCAVGPEGGTALVNETVAIMNELFNNLKVTLPDRGALKGNKPVGDGWQDLLADNVPWEFEPAFWKIEEGRLHAESTGGDHHFAWTKEQFADFELHAVVKMNGDGANSGVGIRLTPVTPGNVPGYQVDMGPGYWGSLWEEGG